jgi:hypothetical protein
MAASRVLGPVPLLLLVALTVPAARAQWVEFIDESDLRISADPALGRSDVEEKDYAWGDVDRDGDTDLVVVRKEEFTSPGKRTNVLFINEGGVLVDRTADFATDSSVSGDSGFLTPTNDRDVILHDLDLDGWLDVVTAVTISDGDPKAIGHPRIYMNRGCSIGGTAASACTTANWLGVRYDEPRIPTMESHSGNSDHNPRFCSVSAGDVTGDGYPDLYFGDYDSSGSGGSSQPPGADFNDKLLINQGAANPGFFTDVTPDPARFAGTVPTVDQSFEVSAFGAANAIRDMNDDALEDIVKQTSLSAPTYVGVAYNDTTGAQGFFDTYDVVNQLSPYFVSVGDLNNDDWLDMVITDDGADRYLLNQGDGGVPTFLSFVFSFSHSGVGGAASDDGFGGNSVIRDLDRDGWNDVLIADVDVDIGPCPPSRRMHIYKNLGGEPGSSVILQEQTSGTGCQTFFGNPDTCMVTGISADKLVGVHDVGVFDLDGDDWDDLVVGRCFSTEVYLNAPPGAPAGAVSQSDPSAHLLLDKSAGQITLSWGESCILDDTDYSLYAGDLEAPFDKHFADVCSTSGATTLTLESPVPSTYYLVVPHNGVMEGSYGRNSELAPRVASPNACRFQNVGACE